METNEHQKDKHTMNESPKVLRIKRKRDEGPLVGLILEQELGKRTKLTKDNMAQCSAVRYFKLQRTEDQAGTDDAFYSTVLTDDTTLLDSKVQNRRFKLPKRKIKEDLEIPHELSEMLQELMTDGQEPTGERKKRTKKPCKLDDKVIPTVSSYVYDVYLLSETPLSTQSDSHIGYVKFQDSQYLAYETENDTENDEDDSNAEDYYRNDYPSGELDEESNAGFDETEDAEQDYGDEVYDNLYEDMTANETFRSILISNDIDNDEDAV